MHVIPQLRKLEHKYRQEMVIVGVHAGKFLAERLTENIRQAVLRLRVDHPVVNDRFFRTWRSYSVTAWPTIALIDPDGNYVGSQSGEITFELFDPVIEQLVSEFDLQNRLDRSPLAFRPERQSEPARPLAFPGKVLVAEDGRLFIADTGHNRILVLRLDSAGQEASVQEVIGGGTAGMHDGGFATATFDNPLGMAVDGAVLFVADAGNHAIRAIDLDKRVVETVAGTGEQARGFMVIKPGHLVALNSPWDLAIRQGTLYVAMAGAHQLWAMDLASRRIAPYAGNGFEDLVDGGLSASSLAQPSGVTSDGQKLYFADTEASAIRWADLSPAGGIHTIVGTGLFDYGDKDDAGDKALLQHPQGVVWYEGRLYVADTYNNKIKIIDPGTRQVMTLLGTGEGGLKDGDNAQFDEPGGISAARGRLYIADTNNHAVRVADLATGRVDTLRFSMT